MNIVTELKLFRCRYFVMAVNKSNGKSTKMFNTGCSQEGPAKEWLEKNLSLVNYWLNSASISVQLADTKTVNVG